jgi:hypothetical protein
MFARDGEVKTFNVILMGMMHDYILTSTHSLCFTFVWATHIYTIAHYCSTAFQWCFVFDVAASQLRAHLLVQVSMCVTTNCRPVNLLDRMRSARASELHQRRTILTHTVSAAAPMRELL